MTDLNENKSLSSLAALKSTDSTDSPAAKEQEFKEYKSARAATRLITDTGFRITFTKYTYLTQNEDAIKYLDEQIKLGVPGITYAGIKTSSDLDPMAAMRKKFYAEFEAEQKAKLADAAIGKLPNMGNYEQGNLNPVGTDKAVTAKK